MQKAAGTQSEMKYIGRQHATMSQWVALRLIFEVCTGEKGYEGGGHRTEGMVAPRGGVKEN